MRTSTEIVAKANQRTRTFTIRTYNNGKLTAKYRTVKLSQDEFDSCLYNTENDWRQFLKSSDYYEVK